MSGCRWSHLPDSLKAILVNGWPTILSISSTYPWLHMFFAHHFFLSHSRHHLHHSGNPVIKPPIIHRKWRHTHTCLEVPNYSEYRQNYRLCWVWCKVWWHNTQRGSNSDNILESSIFKSIMDKHSIRVWWTSQDIDWKHYCWGKFRLATFSYSPWVYVGQFKMPPSVVKVKILCKIPSSSEIRESLGHTRHSIK